MESKSQIVIIDDTKSSLYVLETISKMLCFPKSSNSSVRGFNSYESMLEYYENKDLNKIIDVFVCDYEMRGMNGMQFMKYYTKLKLNIPVIFVTGRCEDDLRQSLLKFDNVEDVLFKPFNSKIFCETIHKAIQKSKELKCQK